MFVALALTIRSRGNESAPAAVGEIAPAARRSWSTSTKKVNASSGSRARTTATLKPCRIPGVRNAVTMSRHEDTANSSEALRMIASATSSA